MLNAVAYNYTAPNIALYVLVPHLDSAPYKLLDLLQKVSACCSEA